MSLCRLLGFHKFTNARERYSVTRTQTHPKSILAEFFFTNFFLLLLPVLSGAALTEMG